MNIHIQYGKAVTVLPAIPPDVLERATAADLRLLYALCRPDSPTAGADLDAIATSLAPLVGGSAVGVAASLAFWRGAGILDLSEGETDPFTPPHATVTLPETQEAASTAVSAPSAIAVTPATGEPTTAPAATAVAPPVRALTRDSLPQYTSDEIADLLEKRAETAAYIHECEQMWGKMFNTMDVNILLGLSDYLGLPWEYIFTLMAHCLKDLDAQGGGRSLRYLERTASSFYDEGIRTFDALQDKLHRIQELRSMEGKLRALFGMGERALTPKEKKLFSTWLYEFHYDMDIISRAYETTIDAKGIFNLNYMNSVLTNWNEQDLRTVEAIEAAEAAYREQHAGDTRRRKKAAPTTPAPTGSFNTEDFFDAAVRRSFGEDATPKED